MLSNTTGAENCAFGSFTMGANTTGSFNTAYGMDALRNCTTGNNNTALGHDALKTSIAGSGNVAVGAASLSTVTGGANTGVGTDSLGIATTGTSNTAVGAQAGSVVTSGSNNLLLGHDAGTNNAPSGNVGTSSNQIVLGDNSITTASIKVSFTATSDERDKADITDFTKGLNFVNALRPVTYKWDMRSNYSSDLSVTPDGTHKSEKTEIGLIAQEVETVEKANGYGTDENNRLLISKSTDGLHYGLRYERLVPILVNAIKELSTKVTALEAG